MDLDKTIALFMQSAKPYDQFNAMLNVVPGTLHPDHVFYDLHAIARDGTRWTAQRFIPKLHWDVSDATVLANGDLLTMSARVNSSGPHSYLRLHFFEKYDVSLNKMSAVEKHGTIQMVRDRADFEALGAQFDVRTYDNDTVIEVRSESPFPTAFHQRVQEALEYQTGKPAMWRARLETEGKELCIELMSPWRKSVRAQFGSLIAPSSIEFHNNGWRPFIAFLAYVVDNTSDTYWNSVAYHLHNAYEATANSIDARWPLRLSWILLN
jgi:hypothetical protein